MIEKILKDTYVNPKVELTQTDYNRLVQTAHMKAKKIEEKAREFYEKEGVVEIRFEGNIVRKRYGEIEHDRYEFTCKPSEWNVSPSDDFPEGHMFGIPQKERQRIAQKVGRYVEEVFVAYFGERLYQLNEIERLKHKAQSQLRTFVIWTVIGWLLAIVMLIAIFLK